MFGRLFGNKNSSPSASKGQLENQSAKTARAASGKGGKGSQTPGARSSKQWGKQSPNAHPPAGKKPATAAATPTAAAAAPGGMFSGMSLNSTPLPSPAPNSGGGGGLFSGMSMTAPATPAPEAQPAIDTANNNANDTSAFGFLGGGDGGDGGDAAADAGGSSAFGFLGGGDADATTGGGAADNGGGNAFAFMAEGGNDSADPVIGLTPDVQPQAQEQKSLGTATPAKSSTGGGGDLFGGMMLSPSPAAPAPTLDAVAAEDEPAPDTTEGRMKLTTRQLDRALAQYWHIARLSLEKQAGLRARELALSTGLKLVAAQLQEKEAAQGKAIEAEEFDVAEQLNSEMETLKAQQARDEQELATVQQQQSGASDQQQQQQPEEEVRAALVELRSLREKQAAELSSYSAEQSATLEKREDELNTNLDRVERSLKHVESDLEGVAEDEAGIEKLIEEETAGVTGEKTALTQKEMKLEMDLEDLKRQLEAKEHEIEDCRVAMQKADEAIAAARVGHDKSLARVRQKREGILADQAEAQQERAALEQSREELKKDEEAVRQTEAELKALEDRLGDEVRGANSALKRLKAAAERWSGPEAQAAAGGDQGAATLLADKSQHEESIESLRAELVRLETEASQHHQNISAVNMQVPSLEAAKKVAVTSRNFKEAGKVSKEIKRLQGSKEDSEAKLADLQQGVGETQTKLTEETSALEAVLARIATADEADDKRRLLHLVVSERRLRKLLEQVDKQHEEQQARAASEGSLQVPAGITAEREALQAELDGVQSEADKLREKHSWAEDVVVAPEEEEDEEEAEEVAAPEEPAMPVAAEPEATNEATTGAGEMDMMALMQSSEKAAASEAQVEEEEEQEEEEVVDPKALVAEVLALRAKAEGLDASIMEVVEAEDFEAADKLETEAKEARAKLEKLEATLKSMGVDPDAPQTNEEEAPAEEEPAVEQQQEEEEEEEEEEVVEEAARQEEDQGVEEGGGEEQEQDQSPKDDEVEAVEASAEAQVQEQALPEESEEPEQQVDIEEQASAKDAEPESQQQEEEQPEDASGEQENSGEAPAAAAAADMFGGMMLNSE